VSTQQRRSKSAKRKLKRFSAMNAPTSPWAAVHQTTPASNHFFHASKMLIKVGSGIMAEMGRKGKRKSGFVTTFFQRTATGRRRADDRGRQKDQISANHPLSPAFSRMYGDSRREMLMEILEEIRRPASLIIDEG